MTGSETATTSESTSSALTPAWRLYKVGGLDTRGRHISIILSHLETHIIYEAEGTLQLEGHTDSVDRNAQVNNLLAEILAVTPREENSKRMLFYQLAVALDTCMAGDCKGGIRILKGISERARAIRVLKGQLWYLWGCIGTAALILALAGLELVRPELVPAPIRMPLLMAALGGLGGVLSVTINLRKIKVDVRSGVLFNSSAGAARAIIAALAAVFIHFSIEGDLLLGLVAQRSNANANTFYALAMLAGFSETLVPNSLKSIEATAANQGAAADA